MTYYNEDENQLYQKVEGMTLNELITNIGYLHMTGNIKPDNNNYEKYIKTVQIYTEYSENKLKIIQYLTEKEKK